MKIKERLFRDSFSTSLRIPKRSWGGGGGLGAKKATLAGAGGMNPVLVLRYFIGHHSTRRCYLCFSACSASHFYVASFYTTIGECFEALTSSSVSAPIALKTLEDVIASMIRIIIVIVSLPLTKRVTVKILKVLKDYRKVHGVKITSFLL